MTHLAVVPGDLTVNIAVVPGPDAPVSPKAHLQRGRFIVFPDGSLRYGGHDDFPVRWMPPLVRRLSRVQMAAIWNDLVNTGLGNPDNGAPPVNMHLQTPPKKRLVVYGRNQLPMEERGSLLSQSKMLMN